MAGKASGLAFDHYVDFPILFTALRGRGKD